MTSEAFVVASPVSTATGDEDDDDEDDEDDEEDDGEDEGGRRRRVNPRRTVVSPAFNVTRGFRSVNSPRPRAACVADRQPHA